MISGKVEMMGIWDEAVEKRGIVVRIGSEDAPEAPAYDKEGVVA